VTKAQVVAARHALTCGPVKELMDSVNQPMSPSRFCAQPHRAQWTAPACAYGGPVHRRAPVLLTLRSGPSSADLVERQFC